MEFKSIIINVDDTYFQVWFSNRRAKWRRHQRMNKSRRSGVAAASTVSGGSSGSAAGTPTPPVVSPVTGPVGVGAAVAPDGGVHCSAAVARCLGGGENSAFRSLVPQHHRQLQQQQQQQRYDAASESSEEINVTTDDEDDDELRSRHRLNHHIHHHHHRRVDGNEPMDDADGGGGDDDSNGSSSSYNNNNNNEDDNNDENGKTAVFTPPHFGGDADRQPYFVHHGLHHPADHPKRPIDLQPNHHHHHHNSVLSTIASWREMAAFTALHHRALGQGAAKAAADAAVATAQPLQLTKYDKDRA